MRNFWELCWFEQKKLFQKTYVRIAFIIMIAITLFINIYPLVHTTQIAYVDEEGKVLIEDVSYYEEAQLERKFAEQFHGVQLTNEVTAKVKAFNKEYGKYTQFADGGYIPLMNVRLPYRSLLNLGLNPDGDWENLADKGYQHMFAAQEEHLQAQNLSEKEQQYWREQIESEKTPFTMYYAQGYYQILNKIYWLDILGILFVILCLCSVFSEEIACRTDAIVRASRFGRDKLSFVKLFAGEMAAGGAILILFGITALVQFGVHGIGGGNAPIQLQGELDYCLLMEHCGMLTMGQAVLLLVGLSLLLVLMMGAVTMLFSKIFGQNIPAIVISFCALLLPFVFSNSQNTVTMHIFSYFPFQRFKVGEFLTDMRMLEIGGSFLTAAQMSGLVYGGLAVLLLGICFGICKVTRQARR